MNTTAKRRLLGSAGALIALCYGAPSFAQTAAQTSPPPAPAATTSDGQPATVDDIIVTAQKRSQSLQNVPIVVTTVNQQLLQDTGVKDIKDLAMLWRRACSSPPPPARHRPPRVSAASARSATIPALNPRSASSSTASIARATAWASAISAISIESRCSKGPQGTLFGKSATAGVINILTQKPQFDYHVNASFEVGNYGAYGGDVEVTGPLIKDKLAASLYFADRQRDGYFDVDTGPGPRTATHDTNRNFYTIRGQLLATPSATLTFRVIGDYSRRNELCCIAVITRASQAPAPNLANNIVAALGGNDGDPATPYQAQRLCQPAGWAENP